MVLDIKLQTNETQRVVRNLEWGIVYRCNWSWAWASSTSARVIGMVLSATDKRSASLAVKKIAARPSNFSYSKTIFESILSCKAHSQQRLVPNRTCCDLNQSEGKAGRVI